MKKAELRKKYKSKRKELSFDELAELSENILKQIKRFDISGKTISLFLTIEHQREINTFPILDYLIDSCAKVGLPVSDFETNSLVHRLFDKEYSEIKLNAYQIPEPINGDIIHPKDFDIVFIPLLAIDINGNRVGYGKGFYDRFLSECSHDCQFIGLHLFDIEENIEDVSTNDITLHAVITPSKLVRFER